LIIYSFQNSSDRKIRRREKTMAELLKAEVMAPLFKRYLVRAPEIARKHRAGQFVIVLLHEHGERIPLTIADSDARKGTITLVVQEVGKSTMEMGLLAAGASIEVVGPLGEPTQIKNWGTCVCVGGGAGIAPLLPITRAMKEAGNHAPGDGSGIRRDDLHDR
jgi:ferredoxin--NADP+ reductase